MAYSVVTNFQTTLSSPMTSTQLTVPVSSIKTRDNTPVTLTTADMGLGWYLTLSPGTASEEIVFVTAITPGGGDGGVFTVSASGRGLAYSGGTDAQASGNAKSHNAGEVVILSNVKNVYDRLVDKESNETVGGIKTFTLSPLVPTGGTGTQAANATDIANAITGASGTATETTFGTVKLSVAAASVPDPIAVGDNDTRVPTQSENDALVGNNTDIAVGTANKYVTQTGLQKSAEMFAVDAQASDTYVITLSPVPTSYAAGMTIRFKAATANTGPATLNVNALGPIAITKNGAIALQDNDIKAGQVVTVVYDTVGPSFQIQSLDKVSQAQATTLTGGIASDAAALHFHGPLNVQYDESMSQSGGPDQTLDLMTYTLPANTLSSTGGLRITAVYQLSCSGSGTREAEMTFFWDGVGFATHQITGNTSFFYKAIIEIRNYDATNLQDIMTTIFSEGSPSPQVTLVEHDTDAADTTGAVIFKLQGYVDSDTSSSASIAVKSMFIEHI